VAPDREQSAVGSSVTLHNPLRVKKIRSPIKDVKSYLVEGTPGDCVILALGHLLDTKIDMVFSGINEGSNLGDDVLLSGTVGAALHGYLKGVRSVAISVGALKEVHFDAASRLAVVLAPLIADLPAGVFLNINLPNLPLEQIKGIEVTRLGRRSYSDEIQPGHDGKRDYYWIVRGRPEWVPEEGTDIWAFTNNKISITPLYNELTNLHMLSAVQELSPHLIKGLFNQE
jgi:5'-nucleotidase